MLYAPKLYFVALRVKTLIASEAKQSIQKNKVRNTKKQTKKTLKKENQKTQSKTHEK